jgi:hypothetical protein
LIYPPDLVIDAGKMTLSAFKPGRCLRLALLLLMLAAQGVVNAHELGASHAFDSGTCATCVIGHGLGTAVSVSHESPQVPVCHALTPIDPITVTLRSHTHCHFARAPPALSGTPKT